MSGSIAPNSKPITVTSKQLRDQIGSVFVLALAPGSQERELAEKVVGNSTYLRGKDDFDRAAEVLRELPNSVVGDEVCLTLNGKPTLAGGIVEAWRGAASNRDALFDEQGATGRTILVVELDGIDEQALWRDDSDKEPRVVRGSPDAKLTLYEAAPALLTSKRPDPRNGVFQTLTGEAVSVKRRGNTSRWDQKVNLCVQMDDDSASGFPKQLNLTNCIRDPSYQRIRLAWALFGEARCPVQPCAYAELSLNGKYRGTYVAMAPLDKYHFAQLYPLAKSRAIFRGQYGDISAGATLEDRGEQGQDYFTATRRETRTYEPRLDTADTDYALLAQFVSILHHSGEPATPAFATAMEATFDVAAFLRVMAVVNLIGSWDSYYLNAQNYFLHITGNSSTPGRAFTNYVPYDQDAVLGVSWPGQKRNWQEKDLLFRGTELGRIVLTQKLLKNPRFAAYYLDFIEWFTESRFTEQRIAAKKAELWQTLESSVYLEANSPHGPSSTNRPFTNDEVYRHAVQDDQFDVSRGPVAGLQVTGILKFVAARRNKVLGQLVTEKHISSGVDFQSANWDLR